jgi:hypothetical protein
MAEVLDAPIPTTVDVSIDESSRSNCSSSEQVDRLNSTKLKYGTNTAATLQFSSQFSSPLGLFAGDCAASESGMFDSNNNQDAMSVQTNQSKPPRLGISRPSYGNNQKDDDSCTMASARIGIVRPNYEELPEGEMPLTPLDLYLDKKKASSASTSSSPTPNLVAVDHDSGSDGDNLWQQIKLAQQQQNATKSVPPPIQPLHDNVDRLVHQQTSEGHYLVNSRPLDSPMAGLKYSLTGGKKAMTPNQRRASVDTKKTRPNNHSTLTQRSSDGSSTKSAAVPSFKIFLLLIQPQSKIFEIIQVFYTPSQTTIQNVLEMIPANATEPALGSQHYVGICRPNDGTPIHLDLMASVASPNTACAKIAQGEILVAIPEHYSGSLCSKISKPILANPKVTKLLTRSDPLAPRKKSKRKKKQRVIAIETVTEETESMSSPVKPARKDMKENRSAQEKDALRMALQHAAREAASTNAQVMENTDMNSAAGDMNGSAGSLYSNDFDIPVEMWKTTMSLKSRASTLQRCDSMGDASTIASFGESNSFCGNQSVNSLDTTDYQYKRMPRRSRARSSSTSARRKRRKKQVRIMVAVVLAMVIRYYMVGRQAVAATVAAPPLEESSSNHMFGVFSLMQVGLAFFAFVKTQRYLEGRGEVQDCRFCQFVLTAWRKAQ